MKKIYFTPGPSQIYPTIPKHIASAIKHDVFSISHRSTVFQELFKETQERLKEFLSIPKNYHVFFLSSATECMERTIQNCVEKESLHAVNGAFAKRFHKISEELGKTAKNIEVQFGQGFDCKKLHIPKTSELICITQNETSTGVAINPKDIANLKQKNPEKLVAIDIVSSVPYVNIYYKHADCVFFSVQKGFGLPAGLGVLIISPQAFEKTHYLAKKGISIGSYHSFVELEKYAQKNQTPETPNTFMIFLLNRILQDFQKIGIQTIRKETEEKAQLLYTSLEKNNAYQLFVKDPGYRSQTVVVAKVQAGSKKVIERLKKQKLIIGSGYGETKQTHIRISNFPQHSLSDVKKLTSLL